ncbi:MAG: cyclic nucleotide-binding domain-containing protein [Chloroflexi bacterium]|nr:cyclic nucleotide-binding domain-containing protein [Chloroflexota bacterium]MDA0242644.1 cyclic nucleotide-binding domain-containing protein [Chloroflexota bacterium]
MLKLFKRVHLFNGLNDEELGQIAAQCVAHKCKAGEVIVRQNTTGEDVYFVEKGAIEVFVEGLDDERVLVVLGEGQVFGEMALIGHGYRSASGRAGKNGCQLQLLKSAQFNELCNGNKNIGYVVMRNLALDLAFKLRHRNLAGM